MLMLVFLAGQGLPSPERALNGRDRCSRVWGWKAELGSFLFSACLAGVGSVWLLGLSSACQCLGEPTGAVAGEAGV